MAKDDLGKRMKENYENRYKHFLPRRTYTIIRLDGKAFHTYTKGLERPFDDKFMNDMDETAIYLCQNIQGVQFTFVQSDEISLLLTDFKKTTTDAWFDGNIQKIVSISASMATAKFNQLRPEETSKGKLAMFDSRVFTIPDPTEVENYFIWRQQDTTRNSIISVSQSLYSHKELFGKNTSDMQEMCFQRGINWNDYDAKYKRGRLIIKSIDFVNHNRTKWMSIGAPIFTQQRTQLKKIIPLYWVSGEDNDIELDKNNLKILEDYMLSIRDDFK